MAGLANLKSARPVIRKPAPKPIGDDGIAQQHKGLVHNNDYSQLDIDEVTLYFEFSFREREPYDSNAIKDIKESIKYWRKYLYK